MTRQLFTVSSDRDRRQPTKPIESRPQQILFPITLTEAPCGIEDFSRRLVTNLQRTDNLNSYDHFLIGGAHVNARNMLNKFRTTDRFVFNFPLLAWRRTFFLPLLLLVASRIFGKQVTLVLHEWEQLHPLRRSAVLPFIIASSSILTMSPTVVKSLRRNFFLKWFVRKCALIPIPPNICRPATMPPAKAATSSTTNAPLRIGYFGSIYKGKSPEALLDVCSELRRRGQRCTVTYVGSIVGASTGGEDWFSCEIAKRKLNEVVSVTGYIADERDLFTLFERIDVFLFVLPEGLSAKRASILTCLQSGRPVVASEPIDPTEFAHHPRYASLVEKGNVILIPHGASVADVASLVQQSITKSQANVPSSGIDYDTWWNDTSARVAAYM